MTLFLLKKTHIPYTGEGVVCLCSQFLDSEYSFVSELPWMHLIKFLFTGMTKGEKCHGTKLLPGRCSEKFREKQKELMQCNRSLHLVRTTLQNLGFWTEIPHSALETNKEGSQHFRLLAFWTILPRRCG